MFRKITFALAAATVVATAAIPSAASAYTHDLVVFDEAHGLADVATTTLGIDVNPTGLRLLATRLTGVGVARNDADPLGLAAALGPSLPLSADLHL